MCVIFLPRVPFFIEQNRFRRLPYIKSADDLYSKKFIGHQFLAYTCFPNSSSNLLESYPPYRVNTTITVGAVTKTVPRRKPQRRGGNYRPDSRWAKFTLDVTSVTTTDTTVAVLTPTLGTRRLRFLRQ